MVVRWTSACLTIVACLAGIVTAGQSTPSSGLIVGRVVEAESGRPISGAIVAITGPPPVSRPSEDSRSSPPRILTGTDGYFAFKDLPPGSYAISAQRAGYAEGAIGRRRPDGPPQPLTLKDGERIGDLQIRMWKQGAITGTVVDEAGEPIVGIQVRCWRRTRVARASWSACPSVALTDDRGVYRLSGLTPGDYAIAASSRTASGRRSFVPAVASAAPLRVSGPASRSRNRLLVYPPTFHPAASASRDAAIVAISSGEERSGVDLQVHAVPTGRVTGNVVQPEFLQLRIIVQLWPLGWDTGLEEAIDGVVTDSTGNFSFPAVPAGEYLIRATFPPRTFTPGGWAQQPVTVDADGVDGVTLVLQRGLRITGEVEFDGTLQRPSPQELQKLSVSIEALDRHAVVTGRDAVAVEATGRLTSAGLAPGRYYVRVLGSPTGWMFASAMLDGRDVSSTPIELRAEDVSGLVLRFTDRWTSLTGIVQSVRGTPDDGAMVLAFPTDAALWTEAGRNPRRMRSARTTLAGAYAMRSMPVGEYYVIAVPDERAADWQEPEFLQALARQATLVTIGDGEHKLQNLRTQEVR